MTKQILKFALKISESSPVEMPKGAEILSVLTQNNQPMLYAMCDTDAPKEIRDFEVYGTGNPVHYDMGVSRKFIGTTALHNGEFVAHVFERIN